MNYLPLIRDCIRKPRSLLSLEEVREALLNGFKGSRGEVHGLYLVSESLTSGILAGSAARSYPNISSRCF